MLTLGAYLSVLVIVLGLLASLAAGLVRLDRDRDRRAAPHPTRETVA